MASSITSRPLQQLRHLLRPGLSARLTWVGLAITLIFILIAVIAPFLQGAGIIQDPTESLLNPIHQPPSGEHWFGTNVEGYDVFSRTLYGSQAALKVVL